MNTKKKRIIRILFIMAASVAFLLITANFIIAYQAERYVRSRLEKAVYDVTGGLYELKFGKIDIDILKGYLSAKDIRLSINAERFAYLEKTDSLPSETGIGKIKSLKLNGVNLKHMRGQGRELRFDNLIIEAPELILLTYPQQKDSLENNLRQGSRIAPHTLYDFIAPYFGEISIANISLSNGNVFLLNKTNGKIEPVGSMGGWEIDAKNFTINSDRTLNNSVFFTDDILFSFENITIHSKDRFYDYTIGKASIDIGKGQVNMNDLGLISPLSKWDFAHIHPKHADWFDVRIGSVDLKGLDMDKLISEHILTADTLIAQSVLLQNYKNGQIPIEHNYMPMIYTSRQDLPIPFFINYVHVSDMDVIYEELASDGTDPGRVTVTDLDGVFLDYTNIPTNPKQTTTLYASGKLMGEGKMEAIVTLPVDPDYDRVEFEARMGVMNMVSLNPIIEPMAPFKLDGGFIQGLDMYIDASGEKAHIDLTLLYNDLSVKVLQPLDNGNKAGLGVISFFANGIIEKNNPQHGQDIRVVHAEHIRDPLHSSFNYLWKIIMSGLVKVLGYTDDRQEKVQWIKENLQF